MDVVFVLDISGYIQRQYQNALMFAMNVANGLDIDSGNVRVGAIAFSTSPLGQFYLRDYNSREAVIAALGFYNPGGNTNTACALDEVLASHFNGAYGARSGVRKVNRSDTKHSYTACELRCSLKRPIFLTVCRGYFINGEYPYWSRRHFRGR